MSSWRCRQHNCGEHHGFISYRQSSDSELAARLQLELSSQTLSDGNHPKIFIDQRCLNPGENWMRGFLEGLRQSKLALLLISEEGVERISNAHRLADNVLLEYEKALEGHANGTLAILPLFVENVDRSEFNRFSERFYPAENHCHPSSETNCTVRQTMRALFQIQGIRIGRGERCCDAIPRIMRELERFVNPVNVPGEDLYIGEAYNPHRTMIHRTLSAQRSAGWTALLSFREVDNGDGDSFTIYVGEAWNPHRMMLFDQEDCASSRGWSYKLSFKASRRRKAGMVQVAVGEAHNPHRCMLQIEAGHLNERGWTHRMIFYVYPRN